MNKRKELEKILKGRIEARKRLLFEIKDSKEFKDDVIKKCDKMKKDYTEKADEQILRMEKEIVSNDELIKRIKQDLGIKEEIEP